MGLEVRSRCCASSLRCAAKQSRCRERRAAFLRRCAPLRRDPLARRLRAVATHYVDGLKLAPGCFAALQDDFKAAAEEAKTLPPGVSNEDQLSLYGLFKQANMGDNETGAPPQRAQPRGLCARAVASRPAVA